MDPYNFGSPEEYEAEQQAIDRRRRMAELLGQSALQPQQGQMVGRIYVPPSPLQGMAQMLTAYGSRKRQDTADEQERAAAQAARSARSQALAAALQGGNVNTQALAANPWTADMALQLLPVEMRAKEQAARDAARDARSAAQREEDRAWRTQEAEANRAWREEQARMTREQQAALAGQSADLRRDLAEQAAAGRNKPPPGYQANPDGTMTAIPGGPADPTNPLNAGKSRQQLTAKDAATARSKVQAATLLKQQIADAREKFRAIENTLSAGPGAQVMYTPQGQAFDAAVNALRSTVTGLTRTPGVGAMSDYETRLDQGKIPERGRYEAVTKQQLDQLEEMADFIGGGYADMLGGGDTPAPALPEPPPSGVVLPPGTVAPAGGASLPGGWSVRVK